MSAPPEHQLVTLSCGSCFTAITCPRNDPAPAMRRVGWRYEGGVATCRECQRPKRPPSNRRSCSCGAGIPADGPGAQPILDGFDRDHPPDGSKPGHGPARRAASDEGRVPRKRQRRRRRDEPRRPRQGQVDSDASYGDRPTHTVETGGRL